METITMESIPILVAREDDGRWLAGIESMPGVKAYGATRESAIAADRIEHGEEVPAPFAVVFSGALTRRPDDY